MHRNVKQIIRFLPIFIGRKFLFVLEWIGYRVLVTPHTLFRYDRAILLSQSWPTLAPIGPYCYKITRASQVNITTSHILIRLLVQANMVVSIWCDHNCFLKRDRCPYFNKRVWFNALWPNEAIWRKNFESTLAQVITWTDVVIESDLWHLSPISQQVVMNLIRTCAWKLHFVNYYYLKQGPMVILDQSHEMCVGMKLLRSWPLTHFNIPYVRHFTQKERLAPKSKWLKFFIFKRVYLNKNLDFSIHISLKFTIKGGWVTNRYWFSQRLGDE